jgi:large subunit ribosomal protein L36
VTIRRSLKALKDRPGSAVVRRHGTVLVINKKNPRRKARQA